MVSCSTLAPPALLLGVVCAFVGCCLAGRVVAARNCFANFRRFHPHITPQTLFYPTASEVRALGRELLDRDRIAVIVGGSSVLRGFGQAPDELWTRHLQAELGDGYRVLNLAMNGAFPAEFGGTAAEMLARDFPRLIFLSDATLACAGAAEPGAATGPAGERYRYFFWDASFKGLLPPAPDRGEAPGGELTRGLRLDALVYSRDLWNALGCRRLFTVWAHPTLTPFTRPRCNFPDAGELPAVAEARHSRVFVAASLASLRGEVAVGNALRRQASDGLRPNALLCFPPALQGRTLLVVRRSGPYYVGRLAPHEQADYNAALPVFARQLERSGLAAVRMGAAYADSDFLDSCHLSESGGRKLAAEVAPAVRRLARRLGYLRGPREEEMLDRCTP